ncbi:MAG: thioesterase family protein [Deltaproteobacteria bacterium]|nr:MAG: thioesterase family protein [Deltaproteobacteria bacterium]
MSFASDTAVRRIARGRYDATIATGWDIGGNANGGYLMALCARALADAAGRPDPVALTAHFLAPGKPGAVSVETEVARAGRRFATVTGSLTDAEGRAIVQLLGTFGELVGAEGPERMEAAPPELPPPDACAVLPREEAVSAFRDRVEMRLHPDDAGYAAGAPSGEPRVRGWFRLPGDEPIDTLALLLGADSFPPTIFNAKLPVGWVPTLELTTHLRARPAPGWLRCAFTTRFVTGGFLEEDGELWDESGRLVAQSRQLALVPRAAREPAAPG